MAESSAVKIPIFNITDPHLWFHMVEATFQLATPKPITESKTKFNYCFAHLPPEVAAVVRDVIITPNAEDPFKKLKEEVIARCGETKSQEIRRLLSGEQLGDRKPSELLRTMQRRAESHEISDSLLLELFLNQLPQHVQSILAAIPSLNSTRAAEIADKVMEVSTSSEVCEVSSSQQCTFELLEEVKALRKEVAALRTRSRSRNRHYAQFRNRQSQSSSPTKEEKPIVTKSGRCVHFPKYFVKEYGI
ncbi:uncharacterized protein [Parasteatoda tepidariorum]|uniref:uncharacterized protein n=1 Tax=Parasteatoda tepidariorum TaxID=114398 RepID=UPI00077FC40C|nr:uncharacterized protein LOC107450270 [Parasteatoda tepidariorum]